MRPVHAPADSLHNIAPFVYRTCLEQDAPTSHVEMAMCRHTEVGYIRGIEAEPRAVLPGYDTGVMAMLIGIFMLLAFSVSHYSTFVKTFRQNLMSVRRRANAFDEHTMSETGITLSLVLLACLCEGILMYFGARAGGLATVSSPFMAIGGFTIVAILFMLFQTASYATTGYAFTDFRNTGQWLKGFMASQALLGLGLTVPSLWLLFNPGAYEVMLWLGASMYILARIFFVCKGFRIFYTNLFSLVYFILYLCTLEIVPLIILLRMARFASACIIN